MISYLRDPLTALGALFATKIVHDLYYLDWKKTKANLYKDSLNFIRATPVIGSVVNKQIIKELNPLLEELACDIAKERNLNSPYTTLDHAPQDFKTLLLELDKLKQKFSEDSYYRVSGAVYCAQTDEALNQFMSEIAKKSKYTNPLHPEIWPKLQEMAAEVVNSCFILFNAQNPQNGFGCFTPGGTYSLIEACKTYRNRFYEQQTLLGRTLGYLYSAQPEIIVPDTAHAGFEKAAEILGCKLIKVPVDPISRRADLKATARQITKNTIMIAGSAPSYPTGTMDDIEGLGQLALKYKVGLHVDACLGGFVVPFLDTPPFKFGFDVPGVSSISIDTHKEGGADKGSSIILYKDKEDLGKYQMSTHMDWSGGLYATPSMGGSASGYAICSAWAMMHAKSKSGYAEDTKQIREIITNIEKAVEKIPELNVMGKPDANVIALTSTVFNPHLLASEMHKRGWVVSVLPDGFHFCVTGVHIQKLDFSKLFISDLKICVDNIKESPKLKVHGSGAIYGATKTLPAVMTPLKEHMAREYLSLQWRVHTNREPENTNSKKTHLNTSR